MRYSSNLKQKLQLYKRRPGSFIVMILVIGSALTTFLVLFFLVLYILSKGLPYITPSLFSLRYTSENVSVIPALINTVIMTFLSLLIAIPLGIGAAIFLAEYARRGNRFIYVIGLTTETLSGIPSIIYGLFGMIFFVTTCGWGYSLLAGACTLAIMILPLILRTTEEALKSVSDTYREGSFGLGAGKLRTIFRIVLPSAVPGILAGIILAVGRIVGETAALIYTAERWPRFLKVYWNQDGHCRYTCIIWPTKGCIWIRPMRRQLYYWSSYWGSIPCRQQWLKK